MTGCCLETIDLDTMDPETRTGQGTTIGRDRLTAGAVRSARRCFSSFRLCVYMRGLGLGPTDMGRPANKTDPFYMRLTAQQKAQLQRLAEQRGEVGEWGLVGTGM